MGMFRRKCWHLWGFWFYILEACDLQRKTCMKCGKSKIRRTPRYIRKVTV